MPKLVSRNYLDADLLGNLLTLLPGNLFALFFGFIPALLLKYKYSKLFEKWSVDYTVLDGTW